MTEFYKAKFKPLLDRWREFDKRITWLASQGSTEALN